MLSVVGVIAPAAGCAPAAPPDSGRAGEVRSFGRDVRTEIQRIERRYSALPVMSARGGNGRPERGREVDDAVAGCKRDVEALLDRPTTDAERQELAAAIGDGFARHPTFQLGDLYFMWKGSKRLDGAWRDPRVVVALATKVDRREDVRGRLGDEVTTLFCQHAVELALSLCDYGGGDEVTVSNGAGEYVIDWKAWHQFSEWIRADAGRLAYDPRTGKFSPRHQ
ncbi:MAG TPA: hypothetical protein VF796_16530 [Humisphaera sp.]